MNIERLGSDVQCVQCGKFGVAIDAHNESQAMLDTVKEHAELMEPGDACRPQHRVPR